MIFFKWYVKSILFGNKMEDVNELANMIYSIFKY